MKFQLTTILALALTSTAIANFVPVARSNNGIAARSMKHGQRRDEIPAEGGIAETDELETGWDESWEEEFAAAEAEAEAEEEGNGEEVARREDVGFPIEGAEVAGGEGEGEEPEVEEEGDEDEGDEGEDKDEEKGEADGEGEGEAGW